MSSGDFIFLIVMTTPIAVMWLIDRLRGSDKALEALRLGYIPARWQAAYRRDHPERHETAETDGRRSSPTSPE